MILFLSLFFVAFFAGTFDAIAGGGGLVTLPTLMSVETSTIAALGTNKLQAVFGVLSSSRYFIHRGIVDLRKNRLLIGLTVLGSFMGFGLAKLLSNERLIVIIPFMLIAFAVYFLFSPIPEEERKARLSKRLFTVCGLLIGMYDGFLGPGTGSFWVFAFVSLRGMTMLQAVGHARVMNASSNLGAGVLFLLSGHFAIFHVMVMALGQILGGQLGAHLACRHGQKLIRPIMVFVSFVMIIRLLLQHPEHPIWKILHLF